jgi:hypothetical protein
MTDAIEAFDFASIKANIAAIVDQDLTERGITILATQPVSFQNCQTPVMFPSRNPTINLQQVTRFSFGAANPPTGRAQRGQTRYTLDYVYLHAEYTQQTNQNEYEVPISRNLSAIIRAITRVDRSLGRAHQHRVLFQSAEIDYNLQEPVSGKQYLGAHVVLAVDEIFEL